ncbi:WD40/YVTN/BNR-like repeat-containing protein [Bacteroidota bacterium]
MRQQIFTSIIILSFGFTVFGQVKTPITEGKARLELYEQHKAILDTSSLGDLHWQFLGPTNISGRCTDIEAVRPRGKSYTIYAATASGGVWKSVNEGLTWKPIFEDAVTTDIGDIAIDPNNPETIWVGTGEANIFRSSMAGCGIWKSEDGGESWVHMGLENTYTIARIVIDPTNSEVLYVAASGAEWTDNKDRGVYKSTDGGNTWENVLYINERTGAIDLVIDPSDPNTIYAATWQRIRQKWNDPRAEDKYSHSGIWKSTDGAANWKKINSGLPSANERGRIGIDLCASKPNVVYAFVDNYQLAGDQETGITDSYGRPSSGIIKGATVYRSDDGGENWDQVSGVDPDMVKFMERHSATYGWVFGQIRVDPVDENTIYTMGLALNVSNDGGKTFKRLRGMHGDHHGLWIDPDNTDYLLNANDGGVCVSYDRGENWNCWLDNLPAVQFFNLSYDMKDPFRIYGSVQDHGSFYGTVDLGGGRDKIQPVEFPRAPGGEGSSHAIHPENTDLVFSAGFYGTISRTDMGGEGDWWDNSKSLLPATFPDEPKLRGQWVAPFILSPHNPDIIYHGMQYVMMSRDRGDTWEYISPDLTYNNPKKMGDISFQTLSSISESLRKFGLIYAGTDDGRLHRTKDGGKTWTEIVGGLPANRWISRVEASRFDLATVYLSQNGKRDDDFQVYLWKSTDFGDSWKDISGNIPVGPVNVVREDPINKNIIYVGTDIGVYVSRDGGKTYNVLGDLPSTYVHDLVIHPRDNMIVIATHGRGIWVLDAMKVNGGSRFSSWR